MRKHLIGTILVLAALAACNKEIDTQTPATVDPVEETPAGKVTLTFKATIGEETRTVYANDKTASWAAGRIHHHRLRRLSGQREPRFLRRKRTERLSQGHLRPGHGQRRRHRPSDGR